MCRHGGETEMVVDAAGAEPEAGHLSLPLLRQAPGLDVGARPDRTGGRPLEAPPRPYGVRAERAPGGHASDPGRVARGRARPASGPRRALAGAAAGKGVGEIKRISTLLAVIVGMLALATSAGAGPN